MKYRMLTREELEIFEEDLKHFLIANGVSSEQWETMNKEDQDTAIALVELFSDTLLQKVFERVKFIEHRSKSACLAFQMGEKEITLISLTAADDHVDLSTPESIHEALLHKADHLTIFKTTKTYSGSREEEIHRMIGQGCVNSSSEFWNALERLAP